MKTMGLTDLALERAPAQHRRAGREPAGVRRDDLDEAGRESRRDAARQRAVGPHERAPRALPTARDHSDDARIRLAEPRDGRAGAVLRAQDGGAESTRPRRPAARRAARDRGRSRRPARAPRAPAHGVGFPASRASETGEAQAPADLPARRAGPERDQHPTRHAWLARAGRSEEHTSELQSHHPISYAVFCLKKKNRRPWWWPARANPRRCRRCRVRRGWLRSGRRRGPCPDSRPRFFFNDTATTEIYTGWYTLSLHDALPISAAAAGLTAAAAVGAFALT